VVIHLISRPTQQMLFKQMHCTISKCLLCSSPANYKSLLKNLNINKALKNFLKILVGIIPFLCLCTAVASFSPRKTLSVLFRKKVKMLSLVFPHYIILDSILKSFFSTLKKFWFYFTSFSLCSQHYKDTKTYHILLSQQIMAFSGIKGVPHKVFRFFFGMYG
jgi:hypothetical protein